jgi:two-component system response regulator YesN
MKIRSPRFLIKLFLFSLALGTLPVLLLGVLSYNKSSAMIEDKVAKGNQLNLQQTQQRVEQILRAADTSATHFINSALVVSAINMKLAPEQFETVNGLLQGLHQLQSFELGIDDIVLASFNQGWVLDNNTEVLPLSDYRNADLIERYKRDNKSTFWAPSVSGDQVHLVKKLPLHSMNPSGLLIVKFRSAELARLLAGSNELGEAMIVSETGGLLAHSDPSAISQAAGYEEALRIVRTSEEPVGSFRTTGNNHAAVVYRKSAYTGWAYVSIASVDLITRDSKAIEWYTYTICFIILVITLALSWLGASRMYRPINRLYRDLQAEPALKPNGSSDEIGYIGSQVKNILGVQSNLKNIVERQRVQLEELFMIKLYEGELAQREISEKLTAFKWERKWTQVCVIAVQIDALRDTRYEEIDEDLLLFSINNMAEELIPLQRRLKPVVMHRKQVMLIGCAAGEEDRYKQIVNDLCAEMKQKVAQFLELSITLGVSRFYGTINEARSAYEDANEALKYAIRMEPGSVIYIEDAEPEGTQLRFPVTLERELLDAVKLADEELANERLSAYLHSVFQEKVSHREYFVTLTSLLLALVRLKQTLGDEKEAVFEGEKSLIDELYKLKTVREVEQWFGQTLIHPLITRLEGLRKKQYARISDQMLAIIHNEAGTELSLDDCAARLGYHPDYIRGVFRKEVGVNFSEYLSNYRLKQAKELLTDTELKITDIAEKLHYTNPQNFIRYFRKQEGMTPGQYRDLQRKKE